MAKPLQRDRILSALSVGNVVTVGIQVFRSKSDDYMTTSLQAHLWFFLGLLGTFLTGGIGYVFGQSFTRDRGTSILLAILFALPMLGYSRGRLVATGGLLSRLMFNKLRNRSEPKTELARQIFQRKWTYLGAEIWFWVILFLCYLGFTLALVIFLQIFSGLLPDFSPFRPLLPGFISSSQGLFVVVIFVLAVLLFYLAIAIFFAYITARLWLFDVVLALEENMGLFQAVHRSWQLTQRQGYRSMTIVFLGSLVTAPPALLCALLSFVGPFAYLFFLIMLFPFWQAVKAVLYYDLRSRNEGLTFDLETVNINPLHHLRRVILQTPESIELDLTLAGIGSRTLAWVIDQTLLLIGLTFFWLLGSVLYLYVILPLVTVSFRDLNTESLNQWTFAIASLLQYALTNGYYIAFETLKQGQTPGKRIAKIRVVRDTGQPVGLKESSLRSLLGPIDMGVFFIGAVLITFTAAEKRLGDLLAGTLVIQDQQQGARATPPPLDLSAYSARLAPALIAETNLQALSADQFLTLRDFLGYRSQLTLPIQAQIATKLASQLRQALRQNNGSSALNIDDIALVEATYIACQETHHA